MEQPEKLKNTVTEKLHFLKGIFKINAKINRKNDGERYYNICEYFPEYSQEEMKRSDFELKKALDTYAKYCGEDLREDEEELPVPGFLRSYHKVNP